MLGISAQYLLNSVREVEERMNAGAVIDARSPLKEAKLCVTSVVRTSLGPTARCEGKVP